MVLKEEKYIFVPEIGISKPEGLLNLYACDKYPWKMAVVAE